MVWSLPRLLRRIGADLVHTQYAVPLRCPCPAVVTVHDVSFARDPELMGRKDRLVFRRVVPRAVRAAARVLTVSERTKADLVELYDLSPDHVVVTPNGVDPALHPAKRPSDTASQGSYVALRRSDSGPQEPARGARGRGGRGPPARRRRAGEGRQCRRASCGNAGRGSRATSRSTLAELYRGTRVSCRRAGTRASGSRSWRPWRREPPVVAVSDLRCARWRATRRSRQGQRARRRDQARTCRARAPRRGGPRPGAHVHEACDCRADARRVPGDTRDVKVSAVVVSHGHADDLKRPACRRCDPQVDEIARDRQPAAFRRDVPADVRVLENARPLTLRGQRRPWASQPRAVSTSSSRTPTRSPSRTRWQALVEFADVASTLRDRRPRAALARRHLAALTTSLPTVRGTIVRRTPLRRMRSPYETQREHYRARRAPGSHPVQADWMLGAFLLMRRAMLDEIDGWDGGFRHYCEDIDLCYRASQAGWERLVRPRRRRRARVGGGDRPPVLSRHTLVARCAGWRGSSASTPSGCSRCEQAGRASTVASGGGLERLYREYADSRRTSPIAPT